MTREGFAEHRPPLGLPRGSVRALLTLMIVAVVISEAVRGRMVPALWTETLMIALAHYFTSRRFLQLPPEVIRHLEAEGHLEPESHPLYLPRRTIRFLIVAAFLGLAIYLFLVDRLLSPQASAILVTVFSYFVGILASLVVSWWTQGRPTPSSRLWDDAKAILILLATATTAGLRLADHPEFVPLFLRQGTLGLVLFYFGSR